MELMEGPYPRPASKRRANVPGRPRTACRKCRILKIRCRGPKPSCTRCTRLGQACEWTSITNPDPVYPTPQKVSSDRCLTKFQPSVNHNDTIRDIPLDIALNLADLYFSHVYNSTLLLHRPSFYKALELGTAKRQVTLSVLALGLSLHSIAADEQYEALVAEDRAMAWAKEAENLAFANISTPSEDNLVTFINLTVFYHARGNWTSLLICECNSACTAKILGCSSDDFSGCDDLAAELSRRRFWAAYMLHIFVSQPTLYWGREPKDNDVPLPCREDHFNTVSADDFSRSTNLPEEVDSSSYYVHLISLSKLWSSVHQFLRNTSTTSHERLSRFTKLDVQLEEWRTALPKTLEMEESDVFVKSLGEGNQLALLHTLYHCTMCCLHASIIPLFSFCPLNGDFADGQPSSAKTALKHAQNISTMLRNCRQWNLSLSAGVFGFACYCSLAVQIPFLWCQDLSLKEQTRANMDVNFTLMDDIGRDWKIASCLRDFSLMIYKYHKELKYSLAGGPQSLSREELDMHFGSPFRARTSVLCYNSILWDDKHVCKDGKLDQLDL